MLALTFLGSLKDGALSRSTTMALTFFAPLTAARRQARGPAVLVADRDAAQQALVFADGAAEGDRDLLAVLGVQHVIRFVVALAQVRRRVVEPDAAVLPEVDDHPARRGAEQREPGDLQLAQAEAERAAGVRLLDAARERTLAADARAVGVGEARAGEGAGREDERVLRRQRINGGCVKVEEGLGDQVAAGID